MVLVNVICKTKMFVQYVTEVCRIASSQRSDCGGDPPRDASRKKGEGVGQGVMRIFPDPHYYQGGQLLGVKQRTAGRPAETINTKVSEKVNLIFPNLNLFKIFLVDKVKSKK